MRRHLTLWRAALAMLPALALAAFFLTAAGATPGSVNGGALRPNCAGSQIDPNGGCGGITRGLATVAFGLRHTFDG
jgi:hypothetical protein